MFTPPPSPLPLLNDIDPMSNLPDEKSAYTELAHTQATVPPPIDTKRRTARLTVLAVFLVPIFLILVTISSLTTDARIHHLLSEPPPPPPDLQTLLAQLSTWSSEQDHLRHDLSSSPPPTRVKRATTQQSLPTIPATAPVLPTPFPQPFETLGQNFSSTSCYNFIVNMTTYLPFRSCRPFSLLLQSSSEFIQLQENYTALNTVMWGTCNTSIPQDQCVQNMNWFAGALQTSCTKDLSDRNSLVVNTLRALQAYEVMRQTGCSSDPTTNTYCYMNAVFNSNPSDLYFYQLPLGNGLPQDTSPTCSACTKSIMASYAVALKESRATLYGLDSTYDGAAALAIKECGIGYAPTLGSSTSNAAQTTRGNPNMWTRTSAFFAAAFTIWMVLL